MNLQIKNITQKTSKTGDPYLIIESDDGKTLSCWHEDMFDYLKHAALNNIVLSVKVEKNKAGYWQIQKILNKEALSKSEYQQKIEKAVKEKRDNIAWMNAKNNAVDIVVNLTKPGNTSDIQKEIKFWAEWIYKLEFKNNEELNHDIPVVSEDDTTPSNN